MIEDVIRRGFSFSIVALGSGILRLHARSWAAFFHFQVWLACYLFRKARTNSLVSFIFQDPMKTRARARTPAFSSNHTSIASNLSKNRMIVLCNTVSDWIFVNRSSWNRHHHCQCHLPRTERFKYLGSMISANGGLDEMRVPRLFFVLGVSTNVLNRKFTEVSLAKWGSW